MSLKTFIFLQCSFNFSNSAKSAFYPDSFLKNGNGFKAASKMYIADTCAPEIISSSSSWFPTPGISPGIKFKQLCEFASHIISFCMQLFFVLVEKRGGFGKKLVSGYFFALYEIAKDRCSDEILTKKTKNFVVNVSFAKSNFQILTPPIFLLLF